MVKKVIFLVMVLLCAQLVLAETTIKDEAVNNVIVKELSNSALFNVNVTNGDSFYDSFSIDTLLDVEMDPKNLGSVAPGETKIFEVKVTPSAGMRERESGELSFEYYVKGNQAEAVKNTMMINIIPFSQLMDITLPPSVESEDTTFVLGLMLKENAELDAIISIESELVSEEVEVVLSNENQELTLDLKDLTDMKAGVYETTFNFAFGNETIVLTKDLVLGSIVNVDTNEEKKGMFLSKEIMVTKTNNGNSAVKVTISMTKSVLGSLFTSFSGSPTTKKVGGKYLYEWSEELNPGESISARMKTNYWIPFIILILILIAVVVFKVVTTPQVKIIKKAIRVRTKSGIFAAKVVVYLKNTGTQINNVKIIERLPAFTEVLKDKFGVLTPSEIKKRSVIWDFEKLAAGEEIMFSYVIYSKINVFGKLEVPSAVVTYRDNKDEFKENISNKAYILSPEEKRKEEF